MIRWRSLLQGLIRVLTNPHELCWGVLLLFVQQMGIGAILGVIISLGAIWLLKHINLDEEGLYRVFSMARSTRVWSYGCSWGEWILAVYLVGLFLGNSSVQQMDRISHFHDSLAWLMQIAMFLILGLLSFPLAFLQFWAADCL